MTDELRDAQGIACTWCERDITAEFPRFRYGEGWICARCNQRRVPPNTWHIIGGGAAIRGGQVSDERPRPPRRWYRVLWANGDTELFEGNILHSPSEMPDFFGTDTPGRWRITRIEADGHCYNTVFCAADALVDAIYEISPVGAS